MLEAWPTHARVGEFLSVTLSDATINDLLCENVITIIQLP
jgi:hypothetical protein